MFTEDPKWEQWLSMGYNKTNPNTNLEKGRGIPHKA